MLRLFLSTCFLTLLTFSSIQAQEDTFPEGLRKLSQQERMEMGQVDLSEVPIYGPNFNRWSVEKMQEMTAKGGFVPMYYADKEGKLAAILYREYSEQEKKMIADFKAQQARLAALIGTEAKDFEVTDMAGNDIKLSELRGSVVAINFWFIGCKPCIQEMPELNEIVKEFEGKPVKFVAVALDSESALKKFGEKRQFDYDIVPDGKPVASLYEITGYPTHCIVAQEGKIAYFKSAYSSMTAKEITKTLEGLLHD